MCNYDAYFASSGAVLRRRIGYWRGHVLLHCMKTLSCPALLRILAVKCCCIFLWPSLLSGLFPSGRSLDSSPTTSAKYSWWRHQAKNPSLAGRIVPFLSVCPLGLEFCKKKITSGIVVLCRFPNHHISDTSFAQNPRRPTPTFGISKFAKDASDLQGHCSLISYYNNNNFPSHP